jgi:hypothetical protein
MKRRAFITLLGGGVCAAGDADGWFVNDSADRAGSTRRVLADAAAPRCHSTGRHQISNRKSRDQAPRSAVEVEPSTITTSYPIAETRGGRRAVRSRPGVPADM